MKTPFVCNVAMCDHSVNVFSSTDSFLPLFAGKGEYIPFIPGWECSTRKIKTPYSLYYYHRKGNSNLIYSPNKKSVRVYGDMRYFSDGQTLAYLIFSLLELERQKHYETTAHLASCSRNGKGIILLGERGAGKTSLLLALCKDYGYKLIANDIAVIGFDKKLNHAYVRDGTKIFGLRHAVAKMHHPDLLKFFPKDVVDSWTTKSFILPREIGVQVENKKISISKIFFCHLYANRNKRFFSKKMTGSWIKVNLYENFSRYVRGSSIIPFLDGSGGSNIGFIPPLDKNNFHKQRVKFINYLVDDLGITYVSSGNLHEICEFINKNLF